MSHNDSIGAALVPPFYCAACHAVRVSMAGMKCLDCTDAAVAEWKAAQPAHKKHANPSGLAGRSHLPS